MALSIMSSEELFEFSDTIQWLKNVNQENYYENGRKLMLRRISTKCRLPNSLIAYGIYKNASVSSLMPYMVFFVNWINLYCEIEVPTIKNYNRLSIQDSPILQCIPKEMIECIKHIDLSNGNKLTSSTDK